MNDPHRFRFLRGWKSPTLTVVIAVGLLWSPEAVRERVGMELRDFYRPGQIAVDLVCHNVTVFGSGLLAAGNTSSTGAHLPDGQNGSPRGMASRNRSGLNAGRGPERSLGSESDEMQRMLARERQLQIELAQLRGGLANRTASDSATFLQPEPLVQLDLIAARILPERVAELWRKRKLVAVGSGHGLQEQAYVLDSQLPLLDQGQAQNLAAADAAYSGQHVIGQLEQVGRWTSTILPITDRHFRARARLARQGQSQLVLGAEGIVMGTDEELLEMKLITPRQPVAVGDLVVTVASETGLSTPMLFGEVVEAELPANALEWKIRIKPAVNWNHVDQVQVIKLKVNPARVLAN